MKLSFDLTVADWVAFQHFVRERKTPFAKLIMPFIYTGMAVIVAYNAYNAYKGEPNTGLWSYVSLGAFLVFTYLLYLRYDSMRSIKDAGKKVEQEHPEAFGAMTMDFSDRGIEIVSAKTSKSLTWDDLSNFDRNNKYYFLFSKKGVVYIIPKRSLAVSDYDFEQMLNSHLRKE